MAISEIHRDIQEGKTTARQVLDGCLKRIKALDRGELGVNAVLTLNEEDADMRAAAVDDKVKRGERIGILEGIPMGIKDVFCTKGLRSTAASKTLDNYIPPYDATAVKKLKKAGVVIAAKTNCDEFAHGASGENSAYGPTRNPLDLERVAGGSSSGSGAIVAYKGAIAALGSDTGGSVRAPASFMGLVGLKPTYGRISRYGLMAMSSSVDTVGPIANLVEDVAIILQEICGKDSRDATSFGMAGKNFTRDFSQGIKGLKIAYPKEAIQDGLDEKVKKIFFENIEKLRREGAKITEITMPLFGEPALAAYYIIVPSEISSNLARYDGILYGKASQSGNGLKDFYTKTRTRFLGQEAKRRIMLGNFSLSSGYYDAYYNKAQKVRRLMQEEARKVFEEYDLIFTPTMTGPAFKLGEKLDPLAMYLVDLYSVYANMTGVCAVSLNGGWIENQSEGIHTTPNHKNIKGLPVGVQLMAKWWDEETLLRAAYGLEQLTEK